MWVAERLVVAQNLADETVAVEVVAADGIPVAASAAEFVTLE